LSGEGFSSSEQAETRPAISNKAKSLFFILLPLQGSQVKRFPECVV